MKLLLIYYINKKKIIVKGEQDMKSDEIIENQQQIIDTIVNTVSDIKKIYIFGSYTRKNATDKNENLKVCICY